MIRAILEGRKTQTRRVVKGAWHEDGGYLQSEPEGEDDQTWYFACRGIPASFVTRCPYGKVGDRLWVREGFLVQPSIWARHHDRQPIHYVADTRREEVEDYVGKPSIHMPKWASRISLELTGVKVERLHDITDEDALAEGVEGDEDEVGDQPLPSMCFESLWKSINGETSWKQNPWVWVLNFRRVDVV